ncbi:uncharacterized protein LOC126060206 [Elephas maximus indicus]|uniref:uncharacterized protein LOC126060206 n=1 Tax=Elephas maximus indicus TaxID=99487 RepID=UPI002116C4B5|nr:uncharacterized protein LOC126060206 [Elephas maximus indicus]
MPVARSYVERLLKPLQPSADLVLLLEDAATTRKMVRAAGWCLTCLDALEAAGDAASLRGSFADLAAALLRLDRLVARRPRQRLGRESCLLRSCVPALLAAASGHLRRPCDPQLATSRRHIFALTRKTLGEFLAQLEPSAAAPEARARNGALAWRLRQLHKLLAGPGPERLLGGSLDALLAAVVWHSMQLAACSAPPERLRLVACCSRLLDLRSAVVRPGRVDGLPGTGERSPELRTKCAALWAAVEALSQAVQTGLLRQILDTFTDTQGPLQRLLHAALGTPLCNDEGLQNSLQLFLAAFHDHAKQMFRVAHLVLVCCPRQETGKDMEAAMAGLWGLVARVQQLLSPSHQGSGLNWSPETPPALLQAWARVSEGLLACFDDVLNIPEFLTVSLQDMTEHLDFSTWALKKGDSREFSRHLAYLQGRATHIVQVISRYVDQDRDPIFRNGLWVLIQQLEQSSLVLRGAAEHCTGDGHSLQDKDTVLTMAKHLVDSAQGVREGLDGTNHPDILSPLRNQVQRFDVAKGQHYFILPGLQDYVAPELKQQWGPGLGKSDLGTLYQPADHPSSSLIPGILPERMPSLLPIGEAILAVGHRDHLVGTSACTNHLEQDVAMDIPQGALAEEKPLGSERTTGPQGTPALAPPIIDLVNEVAYCIPSRNDRLPGVAFQLCGRTRKNGQALVAMAGDWYPLCQQLFHHIPAADLLESRAVFTELQQNLATMVQLAAKSGPKDLDNEVRDSTGHLEALIQMQSKLAEVETHGKELLDKVGASDGLQAPKSQEESIEDVCLLWSLAVQDLLQCLERLSGRQGLFLLCLRQAVKDPQGLQEGLVQTEDVSQRVQEAARLSSLLCGDERVKGEVRFLCMEVHVLTDALLDVAQILASSPKPSPSLSVRFELLCWELTLRAKALTGHLSSINADYERVLQDAICPRLSACKDPQTKLEGSLETMVSGIQTVQEIVAEDQESGPCREGLLVALESILVLTKEIAQRVPVLREQPEQRGLHILDWLQWEWAAKAHHTVAQLQAWKGGHSKAWRLLAQCLKPSDELGKATEQDPVQAQLCCEEDAAGATVAGSVDAQGAAPADTPVSSVGTCTAEPASTRIPAATENLDMQQLSGAPSGSLSCPTRLHAEPDQPPQKDSSADSGNRITRITREMAKEVFLMAQSLRRRGHVLTKDQLTASARKIATFGQHFARLIHIIAKNCMDRRCSQELLCEVEQIQTMSNQLHIISSVKASLARSKSSEELLVENAQQLLRAVSKTVRAAEAASLRGLRQPSPDPEELEVAALCMQWRRKLLRHRLQETSNLDCDELGLRKTGTNKAPTLSALVEEVL